MTTTARSALTHAEWMHAAEVEYARMIELLRTLEEEEWQRPTDCTEWDVREMVAHLAGAAESTATIRETVRQTRAGRKLRPGEPAVDGINAVQVRERANRTPAQLLDELADAAVRGVRARRRIPAPVRALRVPFGPPLGVRSVGYLMDRIYTRDAWMHRIDVARATDRVPVLTAEHDGRIVDDVVREWARAHGAPFDLRLSGPAGGRWTSGVADPLELDAVEFARVLSGRASGAGLLAHEVPF
jgi:uncharacterized protein (TIGR03083 family)